MKPFLFSLTSLFLVSAVAAPLRGQEAAARPAAGLQWHAFPDTAKFQVRGMHWAAENRSTLWRMPVSAMPGLPKGVQNRAKCPSGGRIVFRSTTSRLAVRAAAASGGNLARLEAWVNGVAQRPSATRKDGAATEVLLFEGLDQTEKEIVIYLPHLQEIGVQAIGVDASARSRPVAPQFVRPLPIVFYGSSVCQGSGAQSPAQTYPAILARDLGVDFVNLGFGGAGKAEPEVVSLVNSIPGSAFVFDLGKSYGAQDATAFKVMLQAVRRAHPEAPIIVATPITSAKEIKEPAYAERSQHTRKVMREPALELIRAGDRRIFLLEGEDLLGFKEHHLLSKDGVHPSDPGYAAIAARLAPVLRKALGL